MLQEGQEIRYYRNGKLTAVYAAGAQALRDVAYVVRRGQPFAAVGEFLLFSSTKEGDDGAGGEAVDVLKTSPISEVILEPGEPATLTIKTMNSVYTIEYYEVDIARVRRLGPEHRINRLRGDGSLPPFPRPANNALLGALERLVDAMLR